VRSDTQNLDELGVLQANTHFTTLYEYEILNRLARTTQEIDSTANVVTEYEYDANRNRTLARYGEVTAGSDPFNVLRTIYDERDMIYRNVYASGGANQSSMQFDYDANGNMRRVSVGLEDTPRTTDYLYDGFNRRVSATDPMGNITTNRYDPNSNLIFVRTDGELTDLPGSAANLRLSETSYTYDAMDRLIRTDAALFDPVTQTPILDGQATTQVFYTDNSQVRRVVDDSGHETLTTYDTADRRSVVTDSKTNTATYAYDASDNVVAMTEVDKSELGNPNQTFTTTYAYDNLDRLIRRVDNVGNTEQYAYDSRNNRVVAVDARTNTVRYVYDGLDRLVQTTQSLTDTGDGSGTITNTIATRQIWNRSSRRTGLLDDHTNRTSYVYDSLDRLIRIEFADGTTNTSAYDVHHNPVTTTDANGSVVTFGYDLLNRATNNHSLSEPPSHGAN
jgi:YD repeat-containing protein